MSLNNVPNHIAVLNLQNFGIKSLPAPKVRKPTAKQLRIARISAPPKKVGERFLLTNKEIQALHVAAVHINIWLLDAAKDYPDIEELYNSIKSVSWAFNDTWEKELAYAQNVLNKLANKLPYEIVTFTIPAGEEGFIVKDTNVDWIAEPSLKLIKVISEIEDDVPKITLRRSNIIKSDTVFTAKVKWVQPTINPLTFGLSVAMVLSESKNINIKLRQKWIKLANLIYNDVEKSLGSDDYSMKNSSILASLYTDKMYMSYNNDGKLKEFNS